MIRTAEPYPDLEAIEVEYRGLVEAMNDFKQRGCPLLVDLRPARGRNDPGFEEALARWRKLSLEGHDPLVVLVRTALGRMHVERHMRADGLEVTITTDEAEAEARVRQAAQLRP